MPRQLSHLLAPGLWRGAGKLVLALGFGTFGGWLAHLAGLPLAWLLGALIAAILLASAGLAVDVRGARRYALIVLGLGLGQSFTAPILASLVGLFPLILICAVLTIASGALGAGIYRRQAGLDPKTAFFCGVPGGVVLMAIHAERAGLPEHEITLAQTVRLLVVVLLYPPLIKLLVPHEPADILSVGASISSWSWLLPLWLFAGYLAALIGRQLGTPNPWMLAPTLLAIAASSLGVLPTQIPQPMIIAGQIVLGLSLGVQVTPQFLRQAGPLFVASVTSSLLISAVLIALAFAVYALTDLPLGALLLGMAPGGMPEMAVTAHALGASVPLVLGFHLVRVVVANFLIEPVWRLAHRLKLS
ncbi:AbrB family transcriptional regulator [Alloyangia pacifica]|uniref:Ammonia monooxygenase n=1 Tax=Alloyangia pacifica TaxID=311180 RepID=A0A1I6VHF5_9RHOB|nr:AbrB family transcriptional regulator [Alloyangia pacifica]SDH98212.1 hypothetical protein SAMN04488245_11185 [Alloyangia pacifica]SFT13115.1 hypothetical protein SAMN04488050_11186 [Alloyangia pacifica]